MFTYNWARIVFLSSACAILCYQTSSAQSNLDMFKQAEQFASEGKGCESIPYDTLRRRCTDTTVSVIEYCKEGKRSCDEVKRASNDPAVKGDPQAIRELAEGNRRELELRRGWNEKCRDSRGMIRDIFSDAVTQGRNESDPAIKPIAENLVRFWEAGQRAHQQARDDAQTSADKCRDRLNDRDY
jgi:hypothetical protein